MAIRSSEKTKTMLNGFQSPQTVALLGATSEIGESILRHLPLENLNTCYLAARDPAKASTSLKDLLPAHAELVAVNFHAEKTQTHGQVVDQLFAYGDLDIAIIAAGTLGHDPELDDVANALNMMNVNYVGSAHLMLLIAERMEKQAHGQILIISSFAQTRPRTDNFEYGSTKAGLDFMARGLNEKLQGTGVSVSVVRPGFVRTRMTKLLPPAPFAVNPDVVGKIAVALLKKRGSVDFAPSILKWVAVVFKVLPQSVFRRISNR
jgi:decaprenylphospho-beta-D-erythro-pentofuranosid-2-ulose 2-reductase